MVSAIHDARIGALEVQIGVLKLKVNVEDLRVLPGEEIAKKQKAKSQVKSLSKKQSSNQSQPIMQTSTNSVDLRGHTVDEALTKMWKFIDSAMLRGEYALIIIHGHGTDSLKSAIRSSLEGNKEYHFHFKPGGRDSGGDGVTILFFDA